MTQEQQALLQEADARESWANHRELRGYDQTAERRAIEELRRRANSQPKAEAC